MNVAPWDEFSTVKMPAWTQKLDPDCISQILRIVCTLSSLEPLSFECELHPLTGTLLEARIKLQRRLLTLLLPAEHSSTSWQSLPPVKAQKCVLVKNNVFAQKYLLVKNDVFAAKICKRALSHHWKYSTKMCTCKNDVFDAKICKRALVASTEGYLAVAASTPT